MLSALQTGVRVASSPTPAVLLQASRAGTRPAGSSGTTLTAAAIAASGGVRRESLQSAVTRGHLEESLSNTVLFGSSQEFVDVLRAYAGHLAKSAGFGDGRFVALRHVRICRSGRICVWVGVGLGPHQSWDQPLNHQFLKQS